MRGPVHDSTQAENFLLGTPFQVALPHGQQRCAVIEVEVFICVERFVQSTNRHFAEVTLNRAIIYNKLAGTCMPGGKAPHTLSIFKTRQQRSHVCRK